MSQSSTEFRSDRSPIQEGQLAPHNVESEWAVLGSILLSGDWIMDDLTFLEPGDFFLVRHQWIYEAMVELKRRRDPVDHLTVVAELEAIGRLEEIGGAAYIISLINKTPSALNVRGYGEIVERMALRRELIEAAQNVARIAHSDETDIDEVMFQAEQTITKVTQGGKARIELIASSEMMSRIYDRVFEQMRARLEGREVKIGAVPTGIVDFDLIFGGGYNNGAFNLICARPGMGKTAFMLDAAMHAASKGYTVGFVSLEQSTEELTTRAVCKLSGISFQDIKEGRLTPDQSQLFIKTAEQVAELPILYSDDASRSMLKQVEDTIREMVKEGATIIFVDYIQLMSIPKPENRAQELSTISRKFKLLARELKIPVVAGCQLNRDNEKRADKRGHLSDIRESGSLEQDCDTAMFIYREKYYDRDTEVGDVAEFNIEKHRNGKTGMINTIFLDERMQFVNAARITPPDVASLMPLPGIRD